jgi:hypothetical protein
MISPIVFFKYVSFNLKPDYKMTFESVCDTLTQGEQLYSIRQTSNLVVLPPAGPNQRSHNPAISPNSSFAASKI